MGRTRDRRRLSLILSMAVALLVIAVAALRVAGVAAASVAPDQLRPHLVLWPDPGGDRLMQILSSSRFVLLGEATHGTREFYTDRAAITQRLVVEQGARLVVFEADWPSMRRVDAYVRGEGADRTAEEALRAFARYPQWMWRNQEFAAFVDWVRKHNATQPRSDHVRLIGMDLYSFFDSADEAVREMRELSLPAATAQARYRCFDQFRRRPEGYGIHVERSGLGCERHAEEQLLELTRLLKEDAAEDGVDERLFSAYQNARIVKNAELYYRLHGTSGWNLRDKHMVDTIDDAAAYMAGAGRKAVVWAHNSHQGDSRATSIGAAGQWNVGDLMRRRHGSQAALVGFTTHTGTVLASRQWGEHGSVRDVRPSIGGSIERLFHDVGVPAFLVGFRDAPAATALLDEDLWERAIGVQYLPETERVSHYFKARVSEQFDAVIHHDVTHAVTPLPRLGSGLESAGFSRPGTGEVPGREKSRDSRPDPTRTSAQLSLAGVP